MSSERMRKPVGRRPSTEGRKTFVLCVFSAALFCGLGLATTAARLAVVQRGYELGKARATNEQLKRQVAKLKLEVEALENPRRLEGGAGKLGLVKADHVLAMQPDAVASKTGATSDRTFASNGL